MGGGLDMWSRLRGGVSQRKGVRSPNLMAPPHVGNGNLRGARWEWPGCCSAAPHLALVADLVPYDLPPPHTPPSVFSARWRLPHGQQGEEASEEEPHSPGQSACGREGPLRPQTLGA